MKRNKNRKSEIFIQRVVTKASNECLLCTELVLWKNDLVPLVRIYIDNPIVGVKVDVIELYNGDEEDNEIGASVMLVQWKNVRFGKHDCFLLMANEQMIFAIKKEWSQNSPTTVTLMRRTRRWDPTTNKPTDSDTIFVKNRFYNPIKFVVNSNAIENDVGNKWSLSAL